jgi:carbamoyl-phosphate synthase large subunit
VPFVSKATGISLAKAAARIAVGQTIADLRTQGILMMRGDGGNLPANCPVSVKHAVLPFNRFQGVDTVLGPEMRSTGEVMGIDDDFGAAYAKSAMAAFTAGLPTSGGVFVSLADRDKRAAIFPIKRLADLGLTVWATSGTAEVLSRHGIPATIVRKQHQTDDAPGELTTVELIHSGQVKLVVNTPYGVGTRRDGYEIRTASVLAGIPLITTVQGLGAAVQGIEALMARRVGVRSLQEHKADLARLLGSAELVGA